MVNSGAGAPVAPHIALGFHTRPSRPGPLDPAAIGMGNVSHLNGVAGVLRPHFLPPSPAAIPHPLCIAKRRRGGSHQSSQSCWTWGRTLRRRSAPCRPLRGPLRLWPWLPGTALYCTEVVSLCKCLERCFCSRKCFGAMMKRRSHPLLTTASFARQRLLMHTHSRRRLSRRQCPCTSQGMCKLALA